jgi:hypothetical protein
MILHITDPAEIAIAALREIVRLTFDRRARDLAAAALARIASGCVA